MAIHEEIKKHRQEIKATRMDMSYGEIINMYKDKEIIISPEYQRAFRWDESHQSDFIESILLGLPIPSIFVATNQDGKWELIDGLQRVSTILAFFNELKDENGTPYPKNGLTLKKGSMIKDLEGLTIDTLPLEYKLLIKRTPCRVEIILSESDFNMRYELFKRLNTGGEGLSRQEIRNCIFRGLDNRYNQFVRTLADNPQFRELVCINSQKAEEMYYEELILRFLTLKNAGTRYSESNIQDYMDSYLEKKCRSYSQDEVELDKILFTQIMEILIQLKDNEIFRLGTRMFTTSMYDSIMLSLADSSVDLSHVNIDLLLKKISALKKHEGFSKYVGSASSTSTSITNKVSIARKILLGTSEN